MALAFPPAFDRERAAAPWPRGAKRLAGSTAEVWGDGFADDHWVRIATVTSLAQCSSDEYIRLFPRLLAGRSGPDPLMVEHLSRRAWACADSDGRRMLQAVLPALRRGDVPSLGPMCSAAFAFHAALHPAYLWPDVLCTAGRDTAAGWLGHLYRGRSALMPPDVAEYLFDTIVATETMMQTRDPAVAALVDERDLAWLRAWADRRLAGSDRAGRLRRGRTARWPMFGRCQRVG